NDRKRETQERLEKFVPEIQTLDPEARLKYRGSLAKFRKGVAKEFGAFDPWNFDIDLFVQSDTLLLDVVRGLRDPPQEVSAEAHPLLRAKLAGMAKAYAGITGIRKGSFSMKLRSIRNVKELLGKAGTREFAGER